MSDLDDFAALADRLLWRPIESAPKMRVVLLWAATDRDAAGKITNWKMATGAYHTGYGAWEWEGRVLQPYDVRPTHWMPLPDLPPEIES
jgi:hypothetical protein